MIEPSNGCNAFQWHSSGHVVDSRGVNKRGGPVLLVLPSPRYEKIQVKFDSGSMQMIIFTFMKCSFKIPYCVNEMFNNFFSKMCVHLHFSFRLCERSY